MRNIISFFFIYTLIITTVNSQSKIATLEETTKWMVSKVEGDYDTRTKTYYEVGLNWSNEKKILQYIMYTSKSLYDKPDNGIYVVEFDPINIDPKSFSIERRSSDVKINFSCNNGSGCMKSYNSIKMENGEIYKQELFDLRRSYIYLKNSVLDKNQNLPERFIKAFKHLIKLRGGSGEKF